MKVLFWPATLFIECPQLAFVVAAVFAVLLLASPLRTGRWRTRYHLVQLLAFVAWILFGLNEIQARAAGWNIRVDLLLTMPLMLLLTSAAVWSAVSFWRTPAVRQDRVE